MVWRIHPLPGRRRPRRATTPCGHAVRDSRQANARRRPERPRVDAAITQQGDLIP